MDASTTATSGSTDGRRAGTDRLRLPDGTFAILTERHGESAARVLLDRFGSAFPTGYRETMRAEVAVGDIERVEALVDDRPDTELYRPPGRPPNEIRWKVYRRGQPIPLSRLVPLFEHLGLQVVDERPTEVRPAGGSSVWIHDLGLQAPVALTNGRLLDELRATFADLWAGRIEDDGCNRLVLLAGLTRREVAVVRTYVRYLPQTSSPFSIAYVENVLVANPTIAAGLVELFAERLDPDRPRLGTAPVATVAEAAILEQLDEVGSLDEDKILRSLLRLVEATTRTNAFQIGADGLASPCIAIKLDPALVPDLPLPRPMFEIWVCSPKVDGVHLRGGPIARGGIRWSDRREDVRTEVLGLMKAQMVKNAVIVPVGAKGGFVVKQRAAEPEAERRDVVACYEAFIGALLDVTDNLVGGAVVPPPRVVRLDGDDPYLVVAADKGTATFSDNANAIAVARGFWLGDAFASGGSRGYDHKVMAITARGAWESVRRHLRTLAVDADAAPLTVVGIGDMSGDVFGNAMLLSEHLQLVAAFDHRHVFLDPRPNAAAGFAERRRLFRLPRSSWDDYDRTLISRGGGVWPRSAKAIEVAPEVRAALGIDAEVLTPAEVISAILKAPVDLLWNGGIGTYVKAVSEANLAVGDRTNDAVRVNGSQLRCKVVGEGGNLGFTQRGRIEAALNGVLLNTDAIDNSAGVDCSDHEVNIKILLGAAEAAGQLNPDERDALLVAMTDDVAELVLEDNIDQNLALAVARMQAAPMVDVHAREIRALVAEGLIDRDLEALPTDKQFVERQAAGIGLTTPELAVLLAYTKTTDIAELVLSDVPDDPYFRPELVAYFPPAVREPFAGLIAGHPLRRQIVATRVVNDLVNRAGLSFDFRMTEEMGATVADTVRAHVASRDAFAVVPHWQAVQSLTGIDPRVQIELLLRLRYLVEGGVTWLLRHRHAPLDIGAVVAAFGPGAALLAEGMGTLLAPADRATAVADEDRFRVAGVPAELARRATLWPVLHVAFDLVEIGQARGRTPLDVAVVYWALLDRLDLCWLRDRIGALPHADRWQAHAQAALADDLEAELRELTGDVLRSGDLFSEPGPLMQRWLTANQRGVERLASVYRDIRTSATFNLTTLTVALRQLQNLSIGAAPTP